MALTIRSKRVLLREHDSLVIKPANIHVRGPEIVGVTPIDQPLPPESALFDAGERLVTPAFVNAHTHLALAFLRGVDPSDVQMNLVEELYFAFESRLSADDVRAFARMGAYESLLSGVGFVWDHYYGGEAVADALADTGLTGVVAPTVQDLAGPGRDGAEDALAATLRIADDPRRREAGIFAALGPHATDTVSPALLRRIAQLAEQHRLPVHIHVAQSYEEFARVETREGRSPLALLGREGILARAPSVVMAHGLFISDDDLKSLDPARHTLVYCPSSQMQFGFPAPVPRWSALGASWVVATDCASSNDSMNLQKELRICHGAASFEITGSFEYASFLGSGDAVSARETWRDRGERMRDWSKEVDAARLLARVMHTPGALHPDVRAGVIAPGALANLIVWDIAHPSFWPARNLLRALALSDTTQAIHALFIAGRPIGEAGRVVESVLASEPYRAARSEADARLAALMR